MSQMSIRKLLATRKTALRSVVNAIIALADGPVGIEDTDGNLIMGDAPPDPPRRLPVERGETLLGWVVGGEGAVAVADLLIYAVQSEYEKQRLGAEILDKYRELNLLYNISEKLAARSGLRAMAKLVIEEVRKLIATSGGAVMLRDVETGALKTIAAFSQEGEPDVYLAPCEGIITNVIEIGKAEIVNNVAYDPRLIECDTDVPVGALLCAPLWANDRVVGVMVISHKEPVSYTSEDLKLMAALAAQTAPVLEHALAYEQKLKVLEQELLDLCTEIDDGTRFVSMSDIAQTAYFKELQHKARCTRARREKY